MKTCPGCGFKHDVVRHGHLPTCPMVSSSFILEAQKTARVVQEEPDLRTAFEVMMDIEGEKGDRARDQEVDRE